MICNECGNETKTTKSGLCPKCYHRKYAREWYQLNRAKNPDGDRRSNKTKALLYDHFVKNVPQHELAEKYGLSRQRVSFLINRCKNNKEMVDKEER